MFGFKKAAPIDRNPAQNPVSRALARFANFGRQSATYPEVMRAQMAMTHIILYRCLDKLGTTVQGVRFYVDRDPDAPKSTRTPQSTMDQIEAVLNSPNEQMDRIGLFYWLTLTLAAYGRIPLKIGLNPNGSLNAIYNLSPDLTRAKYNKYGGLYAYEYGPLGGTCETIPSMRSASTNVGGKINQPYAYEWIKPGMLDPSRGVQLNNTALNAVGLPSEIISMLLKRAYDTASGHPNSKYIIAAEKTLTDPQKRDLIKQIDNRKGDEEESGNVLILNNTKVQVEKLDNDLNNIHSKLPMDDMSRACAGAFGIPVALLGFAGADGSKFANNYGESRLSFFEDTIIPGYCAPIGSILTTCLCPDGYVIKADLDSISAIQDKRTSRAKDLEVVGFLTDDEKRELCGFSPATDAQKKEIAARKTPAVGDQQNAPGTQEDPAADPAANA